MFGPSPPPSTEQRQTKLDDEKATEDQIAAGPSRVVLDPADPHTQLQKGVRAALLALPGEFQFKHTVSGIAATDLFSLNTFLGAGIETEVVRTLNTMRSIWDPHSEWSTYRFERSSQAFPDVRLTNRGEQGEKVALGIELKGWWMLSKEGEPSLRYKVSPEACAPHDLVCVVPWHLSSAVSGEAVAAEPWVESARYAAEWRDYWWLNVRNPKGTDPSLSYPDGAAPYPGKADRVTVVPAADSGGNFGRLSRCKPLMDDFIDATKAVPILGIEADAWGKFLKLHTGSADPGQVTEALQKRLRQRDKKISPQLAVEILAALDAIAALTPSED